ncbi:MAG: toxin HicA [Alphaproteobacteria bacterium]|nr:toxin HicA [Alphaproteobacteria bacterium]
MQNSAKLIEKMRRSPHNIRFSDLQNLCRQYFGEPRQTGGSHEVYKMPWSAMPRINIQNANGKAKPEQVRYVLKAIDLYIERYGKRDDDKP